MRASLNCKIMTVCHVSSMHQWDDDRIFQRACRGLADTGIETHLIASVKKEDANKFINKELFNEKEGVRIHWLQYRTGWKRRLLSSIAASWIALNLKVDIIHFHDPDLLPWMWLISFFSRAKIIFDFHENYVSRIEALSLPFFFRNFLGKTWRMFEYFCIYRCTGVITTTDSMKKLYASTRKPLLTISNVPYLKHLDAKFHLPEKDKNITIITSGSNSDARHCLQTIEALPKILTENSRVFLKFVGDYYPKSYKKTLLEKAKQLNVENKLILEGMYPWIDNFMRVGRAHIGCVFYEKNANNLVTIPNRLFEYMYCGLAVIAERFPEVVNVVERSKCGILVDSNNPEEIAEGIINLMKQDLTILGANGRDAVINKYNFENELVKLIDFYQSI